MNLAGAVHLDTATVAPADREELVRTAVAEAVVPLELEHRQDQGQDIDVRLDAADLGPLSVQSMRMSAIAARRTPRLARDHAPPSLFVIVKRAGLSAVIQDGRQTVVGRGDLVLVRSTQPSLVLSDQPNQQDSLQVPLQDLALPEPALRQALALRLGAELPLAGVLGQFIETLTTVPHLQPGEAEQLARVAVHLVRGLVTTISGAPDPGHDAPDEPNASLTVRLADYLRAHWPDQGFTADRSAAAPHISTGQLYRLLTAQGTPPGSCCTSDSSTPARAGSLAAAGCPARDPGRRQRRSSTS